MCRDTYSGEGRQGRLSGTDAGQKEVCQSCRYAPALGAQWDSFLSPTCLEPLAQDWWAAGIWLLIRAGGQHWNDQLFDVCTGLT